MNKSTRSFLLVTGMHRSNTSMLARMLAHSGVPFGNDLVGAAESNPYGHYEDVELMRLHENMLRANWGNWRPMFRKKFNVPAKYRSQAEKLVDDRFSALGTFWGFKVPHATLFLPLWESFEEAKFFFVFRNPLDVYRSLLKRVGRQLYYKPYYPPNCMLTYVIYNQLIYDFYMQNQDRAYLAHNEDLLNNPRKVLKAASNKLGFSISEPEENLVDKRIVAVKSAPLLENLAKGMAMYAPANHVYKALTEVSDSRLL